MICTCLYCQKEFEVMYPSKTRKFCSKSCAQNYSWQNQRQRKEQKEFECQVCHRAFMVPLSDHRIKDGSAIKYCSKECMGLGKRSGIQKECPVCGKLFYTTRNEFCSQKCARELRKKEYEHKTYMEDGYIVEYKNGYNKKGNVKQHRRIMEEQLGRKLNQNEIVHHINGIKTDNRPENLCVMTRGEHSTFHRKQEKAEGKHLFGGYNNN